MAFLTKFASLSLLGEAMISSIKQNTKLTLADEYSVNASQIIVTVTVNDTIVNGTDTTFVFDIGVDGALYGEFSVHPKTQVIGQVAAGATVFDVDSTVGFPTGGELYVNYFDNTTGVVSFTSKSLTQFFGCSNITKRISDTSSFGINTYAYGFSFSNPDEQIQVRINSVLSNLTVDAGTKYLSKDDDIIIKSLGSKSTNYASKNWIYNVSPTYQVQSVELIDESDLTYTIKLSKEHYLRVGDIFGITGGDNAEKTALRVPIRHGAPSAPARHLMTIPGADKVVASKPPPKIGQSPRSHSSQGVGRLPAGSARPPPAILETSVRPQTQQTRGKQKRQKKHQSFYLDYSGSHYKNNLKLHMKKYPLAMSVTQMAFEIPANQSSRKRKKIGQQLTSSSREKFCWSLLENSQAKI